MRQHYPKWPTRSPDPLVNILSVAVFILFGFLALFTSLLLLLPIAIAFSAVALLRWYHSRPPGYSNPAIAAAVNQYTIGANFPNPAAFVQAYAERLVDAWQPSIPAPSIFSPMIHFAAHAYVREGFTNPLPPLPTDPIDQGRWRDDARLHALKMQDAPGTLAVFAEALTRSLSVFRSQLPPNALVDKAEFLQSQDKLPALTVPLRQVIHDTEAASMAALAPFHLPGMATLRLFESLRSEWRDLGNGQFGNPFDTLLDGPVPFPLPPETRFSGHWILSPPGRGKTTLLHAMVMEDLRIPGACLILMDSKGDLIAPIRNLAAIKDRLVIIDPDPQNPVAINPLDIDRTEVNQTVDLLEYLFASLLEFKMTAMQTTLFRSVLRALVIAFPNPTLETFRDLLTNGYGKYAQYIESLPPDLRDFFENEFNEKNYADRRREVLQRLRLLLDNETMRGMLTAETTRFRMSAAMDTGKVVIINNSKARLGDQGAEFFGRFFITQVLAAAQQRSLRNSGQKPPVYFYIDECQNVIARDEKIPTILDECRSQNIALIMAHQQTKQIASENVLDALSNCAIRLANSDEEARYLAPRLRGSADFLQSLGRGQFAAFVRDLTPGAVAVTVNRVDFSDHAVLSTSERKDLAERIRAEYGVPNSTAPEGSPRPSTQPDESAEATGKPTEGGLSDDPALDTDHSNFSSYLRDSEPTGRVSEAAPNAKISRLSKPRQDNIKSDPTEGAPDWQ
jgi:hypothetical protein